MSYEHLLQCNASRDVLPGGGYGCICPRGWSPKAVQCAYLYPSNGVTPEPLLRCLHPVCAEGANYCERHNKEVSSVNNTPVSQPDGHVEDTGDWIRHWGPSEHRSSLGGGFAGIPEHHQPQGITPEPIRNASNLPRTAMGQHVSCTGPCCMPELYQPGGPKYNGPIQDPESRISSGRPSYYPYLRKKVPINQLPTELEDALHCGTASIVNTPTVNNTQSFAPRLPTGLVANFLRQVEDLEIMNKVYQEQLERAESHKKALTDALEYAAVAQDAYRKVWSARQYILATRSMVDQADEHAWAILNRALLDIDIARVHGAAIQGKYTAYMDGSGSPR